MGFGQPDVTDELPADWMKSRLQWHETNLQMKNYTLAI